MGTKLLSKDLTVSFNRYGDWLTIAGVKVSGNYVTIPYLNQNVMLAT